jgi:hypothetical protein
MVWCTSLVSLRLHFCPLSKVSSLFSAAPYVFAFICHFRTAWHIRVGNVAGCLPVSGGADLVRQTMTDSHGSYCRNGHTEMPWLCGQGVGQCS